jgi:hypothetical protein
LLSSIGSIVIINGDEAHLRRLALPSSPPISRMYPLHGLASGLHVEHRKPIFRSSILAPMPPPYTFSTHIGAAAARKMRNFHDLAAKLNMDVADLMEQCNARKPPSKAVEGAGARVGY